jgi:hypothetical protein
VGDVTLNVSITGTPTVNIQTSGGANIVIDKLTQGAYTERQSTLANNGATAGMASGNLTYKRGKFFPRGCRGFIRYIEIYCDNIDTVSHTFTVKLSPMPGMGAVAVFTLSVDGGSGAAWRTIWVNRFWNYDSLFIWVCSDSDTYGRLGYDAGVPYDYYTSADEVSWAFGYFRYWFRVTMTGETVGDLPVSGTVNTIEVPAVASALQVSLTSIQANGSKTLIDYYGCGTCVMIGFYTDSNVVYPVIKCDDQYSLISLCGYALQPLNMYLNVLPVNTGPGVALTKYDTTNNRYALVITVPLKFKRRFQLIAYNPDPASAHNAQCDVVLNAIN